MKRASRYQESLPSESKPKPKRIRRSAKEHNVQARQPPQHHQPTRRSSVYRGVTRHRWTGRYEAHLWDKNCWNQGQNKKGRQVYLGAYDDEEAAAHTYDLAALKYWGPETVLNFPLSTYTKELEEMRNVSREEYLASLRRRSSGFSRGVSKYRGVARHHHNGRWEARIGRVLGNKYLYLGTYSTQEEAATAYDMAAIEYRGMNAVTNFDLSRYIGLLSKTTTKNSYSAASSSDDEQKIEGKQDKNIKKSKKIANAIEPKKEYEEVAKIVEPKQEYEDVQDIKVKVQEDEYENMNKCQPSSPFSDELGIFFGEATGSEHMLCCEPEEMYLNLNLGSNDVNVSMMNGNGENDVGGPSPIFQGLDALCQCDHECSSEQLLEDIVDPFLDAISIPAIPTFPNLAIRTCS